ncbi:protein mono-ADP-ribosyltransferase PARP10 isoform X2 [Sminthopsis crassicaudata]|uniref:protein mono-ADP-ribosyltransferase PARP10 isoform X2 n=1 Tax=Sminthopsis crassicaudata TaxID=9301 RepID=UPI003D682A9A
MSEGESGALVELRGLPQAASDELVTLYFENRRRSGGGPLRGWQRLDRGGILTFQKPEDAQRVLARASHVLQGTAVSVAPSPPRAPQRLLLLGLKPGTTPELLELYVESVLSTQGECQALASPRPDRALVQLPTPLSEAEFKELATRFRGKTLDGATLAPAWVPRARAVRVVGGDQPPAPLLLQRYLENEGHSGGGALEGLRILPGALGTVATFQRWEGFFPLAVAERVLSRYHRLSGSELNIVPHYDVLDPELDHELKAEERVIPALGEMISTETPGEKVPGETFGEVEPVERPEGTIAVKATGLTVPMESVKETVPLKESVTVERPEALEPVGCIVPEETMPEGKSSEPVGDPVPKKVMPVEILVPMEPGALRFLQLYYQEFLASLDEVILCPIHGPNVTGFQLSGALEPCQAAKEFLQSLLGSIGSHTLPLKHPGSLCFLLGTEGQELLKALEAQFHCALTVEQQVMVALDAAPVEPDSRDLLESPASWTHPSPPPSSTVSDTLAIQMEESRKFLDTLKILDDEWLALEMEERVAAPGRPEELLKEEAALQVALHHSLEETRTLKRALMGSGGADSSGKLVAHVALDQDPGELGPALETALREQLREERVMGVDQDLPPALWSCLEKHHDVTITLQGDCAVLSGYGCQPSCAASHFRELMAAPLNQSYTSVPNLAGAQVPLELECLAESSEEFQETVQAFYSSLDNLCNKIRIIKIQRVSLPLLQSQYELHKKKLAQSCPQHPIERILYHGTSWQAVPDICSHGFNRSFCGRNATLYGQGVYFAVQAKVSVEDLYSPPDAKGHKAVFVARVLTGNYGPGHPQLRVPPQKDTRQGTQRYDSAVDLTSQPRVFVIFHDTQALPIFLITCQRHTL